MILWHHCHSVFLLFLIFCLQQHESNANMNAPSLFQNEDRSDNTIRREQERVKIMVGFPSLQEENVYLQQERSKAKIASVNSKINYEFKKANAIAMEVTRAELEEMQKDPRFSYIEEDFPVQLAALNLTVEEQTRRIQELRSYGIALTQSDKFIPPPSDDPDDCSVYACIVDSGVFLDHRDIPYSRGDAYTSGRSFGSASGDSWYSPQDTDHGTNVAGIMFATGGNDVGIIGAVSGGPSTSRVCLKVGKVFADGSDTTSISTVIQAVEWCADEARGKPMVINLSLATSSQTYTERSSYERIYDGGALIVAAAGNGGDSDLAYPASHSSVMSIASVNPQLQRSSFSQYNRQVELAGPGDDIYVTDSGSSGVSVGGGTSFACPFVAAIAARIWASNPRCSNKEVRMALRNSARRLGNGVPNDEYGYGLVQALDAYNYLSSELGCGVTAEPSRRPTRIPTRTPSQSPSRDPSAAPSDMPSTEPSGVPSSSPTPVPCLEYMQLCTVDDNCCDGHFCRPMYPGTADSWVCRRETKSLLQTKPRLASVDGSCRGGYAGGCNAR